MSGGIAVTLPSSVIAVIRTVVQAGVSWLLSAAWVISLLEWLSQNAGVSLSQDSITAAAFTVTLAVVTWAINAAGRRWDWVNKLFSLFTASSPAEYDKS